MESEEIERAPCRISLGSVSDGELRPPCKHPGSIVQDRQCWPGIFMKVRVRKEQFIMRLLCVLCLFLVLGGAVSAQTVINGPGTTRAFQSPYAGPQTIVRDSKANLYVIYRYQVSSVQWDIAIAQSTNGGKSWDLNWQKGFADLGSPPTDFGNYSPCIAIDSQDNLHCAWSHRVAVTGSRIPQTMRYNRYEAATKTWGTEWIVTPTAKYELNNCCLAVDQNDYVWFAHGSNSYSWHSYIERSDKPLASDGKFTRYSPYYISSGYSQHNCLCVDALGRIHFTYYGLSGSYGIWHQWVDPGATTPVWSTRINLSYPPGHGSRADYSSKMAADNAGNVYVIFPVDSQYPTSHNSRDTDFWISKWDGSTQAWGTPVLIHVVPYAVWGANRGTSSYANDRIISCACDETTGEVYFTYRDFNTGDFVLGRWRGDDTEAPTVYARLMNVSPPGPPNYYMYPHMRGSLWPRTNRASWGLDLTYVVGDQSAPTPTYTDYFEHIPVASMNSVSLPKIGTTYPLDLSGVAEGGKTYVAALSMSGLMSMIQVGRRYIPLVADSLFFTTVLNKIPPVFQNFQGVLNASGAGQAKIAIPNLAPLVGIKMDGCFVTFDVSGLHAISNPWGFTITN